MPQDYKSSGAGVDIPQLQPFPNTKIVKLKVWKSVRDTTKTHSEVSSTVLLHFEAFEHLHLNVAQSIYLNR
jgi:hypothetical protein